MYASLNKRMVSFYLPFWRGAHQVSSFSYIKLQLEIVPTAGQIIKICITIYSSLEYVSSSFPMNEKIFHFEERLFFPKICLPVVI